MADRVGQQLGNYRLLHLLGVGGFAEVYLAEHIHLSTQAAVKVLCTQLNTDDIELFRREAKTIAHLEHPHIVRVLDFGVQDRLPYFVMTYAPYGTLRQRHPKGSQLTLPTVVEYVRQIAAALQYGHDHQVIHRDVKPENILIGARGELLLSDFGIALNAASSWRQPTQGIMGTVAYIAPEQLQGKPGPASDQYALAIIAYEWLSGCYPFNGSITEVAVQHVSTPPPALRSLLPELAPEVEQVILTALAKDPQERFPTIADFAAALEQAATFAVQSTSTFIPDPVQDENAPQTHEAAAFFDTATPSPLAAFSPDPFMPVPSAQPGPQRPALPSRRALVAGLIGLTVVGTAGAMVGSLTLLARSSKAHLATRSVGAQTANMIGNDGHEPTSRPRAVPRRSAAPIHKTTNATNAAPTAAPTPHRTQAPTPTPTQTPATPSVSAPSSMPTPTSVPIAPVALYRLYSGSAGDHFYTTSQAEASKAASQYGYVWEGVACYVYDAAGQHPSGTVPLYRLYNGNAGDHFYTISWPEASRAVSLYGYILEGIACYVFPNAAQHATALYRLYSGSAGDHFYTISFAEAVQAFRRFGYRWEGVACYVLSTPNG